MTGTHLTHTRLGIALAVVVGVALGAVFGQPGAGRAASTAVPKVKTIPTISGTAEVGQTLTATTGSWSGAPTSYHYAWSLCDGTGAACVAVGGATAKIYTIPASDVGHTIRVTVTARNSSGSTAATSAATAVVPPSGCPEGTGTIQISMLAPPAQLDIQGAKVVHRVTRSSKQIQMLIDITACGGRAVQGATVYASPVPFNQFAGEQGVTAADGTITLTAPRRSGFPASRHQKLLAVFVRATAPNEPTLGGVSARRMLAFPVS